MIGPEDTALIFHSWTQHRKYLQHLKQAFTKTDHQNCLHAIAVKTNPHPAILRQLVEWGFGFRMCLHGGSVFSHECWLSRTEHCL